jgi:hypothetical protein
MVMTRDEYFTFHRSMCDRMIEITRRKNADYCGGSPDPFHNFTAVERNDITDTTTGFLVRLQDKFARIISLAGGRKAQVLDESLEDTLLDSANYMILLAGYLKSRGVAAPAADTAKLRLRVGGKYRNRDGQVVTIDGLCDAVQKADGWDFTSQVHGLFTPAGKFWPGDHEPSPLDLVEEVN